MQQVAQLGLGAVLAEKFGWKVDFGAGKGQQKLSSSKPGKRRDSNWVSPARAQSQTGIATLPDPTIVSTHRYASHKHLAHGSTAVVGAFFFHRQLRKCRL
jgi:hypothetical protein